MKLKAFFLSLLWLASIADAQVDSVTLQQGVSPTAGYTGCGATTMISGGTGNEGSWPDLLVSEQWDGSQFRFLIKFDLSGLSISNVDSARLFLRGYDLAIGTAYNVAMARVNRDWDGGRGAGSDILTGEANWTYSAYTTQWSTAGCNNVTADRGDTATVFVVPGTGNWTSVNVSSSVIDIIDNAGNNDGWIFVGDNISTDRIYNFASENNTTSSHRPYLRIWYTPPAEGHFDTLVALAGTGGTVSPAQVNDTCNDTFRDTATGNALYHFRYWSERLGTVFNIANPFTRFLSATPASCAANGRDTVDAHFYRVIALDTTAPASRVRLVFIHHSTGGYWLANTAETNGGGLGNRLRLNNFEVYDVGYNAENRSFAPSGHTTISDSTDIAHWYRWFVDGTARTAINATIDVTNNRTDSYGSYDTLVGNTSAENLIILFKSCYPNSDIYDSNSYTYNDMLMDDAGSQSYTLPNIRQLYRNMLSYFMSRPEKMYVVIVQPPRTLANTTEGRAANARLLADWLYYDWLADSSWEHKNVYVFDYYNEFTASVNRSQYLDSTAYHFRDSLCNLQIYPTADEHPSTTGQQKAAANFVPLLKGWYNRYSEWYDSAYVSTEIVGQSVDPQLRIYFGGPDTIIASSADSVDTVRYGADSIGTIVSVNGDTVFVTRPMLPTPGEYTVHLIGNENTDSTLKVYSYRPAHRPGLGYPGSNATRIPIDTTLHMVKNP